jgi:hypothetical protein
MLSTVVQRYVSARGYKGHVAESSNIHLHLCHGPLHTNKLLSGRWLTPLTVEVTAEKLDVLGIAVLEQPSRGQ